jgi:hypothetical protein
LDRAQQKHHAWTYEKVTGAGAVFSHNKKKTTHGLSELTQRKREGMETTAALPGHFEVRALRSRGMTDRG